MRRVIVIASVLPLAGMGLAGCSSFSLDSLKPTPPTVQVVLESVPSGSVKCPAGEAGFSVTFTMNKFQPATVPVQVIYTPGDLTTTTSTTIDPNPVVAELRPVGPPPKPVRAKPKKPKPPKSAAAPA